MVVNHIIFIPPTRLLQPCCIQCHSH